MGKLSLALFITGLLIFSATAANLKKGIHHRSLSNHVDHLKTLPESGPATSSSGHANAPSTTSNPDTASTLNSNAESASSPLNSNAESTLNSNTASTFNTSATSSVDDTSLNQSTPTNESTSLGWSFGNSSATNVVTNASEEVSSSSSNEETGLSGEVSTNSSEVVSTSTSEEGSSTPTNSTSSSEEQSTTSEEEESASSSEEESTSSSESSTSTSEDSSSASSEQGSTNSTGEASSNSSEQNATESISEVDESLNTVSATLSDALVNSPSSNKDNIEGVLHAVNDDLNKAFNFIDEALNSDQGCDLSDESGQSKNSSHFQTSDDVFQRVRVVHEQIINIEVIRGHLIAIVRKFEDKIEQGQYLLEFIKDVRSEGAEYLFSKILSVLEDEEIKQRVVQYQEGGNNTLQVRADILSDLIELRKLKGRLEDSLSKAETLLGLLEGYQNALQLGMNAHRDRILSFLDENVLHILWDVDGLYQDYFGYGEEEADGKQSKPAAKTGQDPGFGVSFDSDIGNFLIKKPVKMNEKILKLSSLHQKLKKRTNMSLSKMAKLAGNKLLLQLKSLKKGGFFTKA